MTEIQKILLGGGRLASLRPVECKSPWRGAAGVSDPPFDRTQAEENRRLYPHLFEPERRRTK